MFGTWRDELERKLAAGQHDLAGEMSEGARAAAATAGADGREPGDRAADRARAADARGPGRPGARQARRRARPRAVRGGRAQSGAPRQRRRSSSRCAIEVDRLRARVRRLVRAVPALVGRPEGRRARSSRGSPSSASTSSTCRRSIRSATPTARAANNALIAGPDDPGLAVGDRRRDRRPRRGPPRARHDRGPASADRGGAELRHRHRARLRDPVLGRPPVADRAPRVVPPPARRHAQVRREPAQALPGHLQRQLGVAGLARAVGGAARGRAPLGRLRRQGVPGRQPAHQAVRVLGVADRARCTRATATSCSSPRRSRGGR